MPIYNDTRMLICRGGERFIPATTISFSKTTLVSNAFVTSMHTYDDSFIPSGNDLKICAFAKQIRKMKCLIPHAHMN